MYNSTSILLGHMNIVRICRVFFLCEVLNMTMARGLLKKDDHATV